MPRYSLRTLLILLALGPPILALCWWRYGVWKAERERLERLDWIMPVFEQQEQ